jgi:hypothetical protein
MATGFSSNLARAQAEISCIATLWSLVRQLSSIRSLRTEQPYSTSCALGTSPAFLPQIDAGNIGHRGRVGHRFSDHRVNSANNCGAVPLTLSCVALS